MNICIAVNLSDSGRNSYPDSSLLISTCFLEGPPAEQSNRNATTAKGNVRIDEKSWENYDCYFQVYTIFTSCFLSLIADHYRVRLEILEGSNIEHARIQRSRSQRRQKKDRRSPTRRCLSSYPNRSAL